tara:strand:+ start:352 stop:789 length:438 start_codon:yes stop_codon:yes gene_type:complete
MKKTNTIRLAALIFIGTTILSCKDAHIQDDITSVTTDKGTSIMIKSTIQKKEWEKFKITLDSTINSNDIRIAELKIKMKDTKKNNASTAALKMKALEEKNQMIKTKLNTFSSQVTKNWGTFKTGIESDLIDFEQTLEKLVIELGA